MWINNFIKTFFSYSYWELYLPVACILHSEGVHTIKHLKANKIHEKIAIILLILIPISQDSYLSHRLFIQRK